MLALVVPSMWACDHCLSGFSVRADAPLPMFLGEVLSVFRFSWVPFWLHMYSFCWALPLVIILIYPKKKCPKKCLGTVWIKK